MPTLIPERTIDSLLAFELIYARPDGLIWSPTNRRGSWDHRFFTTHTVVTFECKTIQVPTGHDPAWQRPWSVRIDLTQLAAYCRSTSPASPITYLLPAQPQDPARPWARPSPSGGTCRYCQEPPPDPGFTRPTRRWAGLTFTIRHSSPELRLQPWFAHWAWCITAHDLQAFLLRAKPARRHQRDTSISATDARLRRTPRAVRLCHLLTAIAAEPPPGPDPWWPPDTPELLPRFAMTEPPDIPELPDGVEQHLVGIAF